MTDLDEDEAKMLANISWLASAGPDDWHRVALDFNWSEPLYVLDWIIRQPDCDIATALTIFWKGEPECWMEEAGSSDEEPNGFSYLNRQICAYVADRVGAGDYTRSEIAFAPDTWTQKSYVDLVVCEQNLERPNFRTHPDLIRNRDGRDVDVSADFYRRYPEHFHLSHYDGQLSVDLARGVYETPQSTELGNTVDEIERNTFQELPSWLRDQQPAKIIRSDPAAIGDAHAVPAASPDGAETRLGETTIDAYPVDPVEDASSRIRAMRRQANSDAEAIPTAERARGITAWARRLFGR